jgi:hypothetical protein
MSVDQRRPARTDSDTVNNPILYVQRHMEGVHIKYNGYYSDKG